MIDVKTRLGDPACDSRTWRAASPWRILGALALVTAPLAQPGCLPASSDDVSEARDGRAEPALSEEPIEGRALNAAAFARLYGYVRFFHPADEAAAVDWERFALHGAERVLEARDPSQLKDILEDLYLPLAPSLRLLRGVQERDSAMMPGERSGEEGPFQVVAWQHLGVGLSPWTLFSSTRVNRPGYLGGQDLVRIAQMVPLGAEPGTWIRLRGAARAQSAPGEGSARLIVGTPGPGGTSAETIVSGSSWDLYKVKTRLSGRAPVVFVGGAAWGTAEAWFDGFELSISEDGEQWETVPLQNPTFEAGNAHAVPGWSLIGIPDPEAARFRTDARDPFRGPTSGWLQVDQPDRLFEEHPGPNEVIHAHLGRGISAEIPVALRSVDGATIPSADPDRVRTLHEALEGHDPREASLTKPAVRVATVTAAWAILQHFFPYHEYLEIDWGGLLEPALAAALRAESEEAFLQTLQGLLFHLEDGHARVSHPLLHTTTHGLPVTFGWIEGRVAVTASEDTTLVKVGDVLETLDGRRVEEVLSERMARGSGSAAFRRRAALQVLGRGHDTTPAEMRLIRGRREISHKVPRRPGPPPSPARLDPISEFGDGIFYVDLRRVSMGSMQAQIEPLSRAPGVVFDLRGYPQHGDVHNVLFHLVDEPVRWYTGCIYRTIYPDRRPNPECQEVGDVMHQPREPRFQGTAVFLTDEGAWSYAETIIGIVRHYQVGEVVGLPTAGANGDQNHTNLPGRIHLFWSGTHVTKHDRRRHFAVGHSPTIPVEATLRDLEKGRDKQLDVALQLLGASTSLLPPQGKSANGAQDTLK